MLHVHRLVFTFTSAQEELPDNILFALPQNMKVHIPLQNKSRLLCVSGPRLFPGVLRLSRKHQFPGFPTRFATTHRGGCGLRATVLGSVCLERVVRLKKEGL